MRNRFAIFMALTLAGCNAFQTLDPPKGDAQDLAAARSALDRGDYATATQYYLTLSPSLNDTEYTELVASQLSQSGIPVGTFASAIIESGANIGRLLTLFANELSYQASPSLRLELFHNYQRALKIHNPQAQGVMRLVTALALIAEILSEDAATPGHYTAADLVKNPAGCLGASSKSLASALVDCQGATNKKLISGQPLATPLASATDANLSGAPTLSMISAGILEIQTAISLINSHSKLTSSAASFITEFSGATIDSVDNSGNNHSSPIFLYLLLSLGVGSVS